uniref:phosphatidate cytidylyltransferase n=1 Tax=Albugo laibachii Nc14 TaxID=890382 RepID=F0VYM6_9STRA|nr:phosphatidate cytidylyltransferase putative [Albugo laibachii Nc14]|eukprot:CCA13890.1 phosphatidate cytidylyltransferase putative [Albugo laibachii Nc14]
MGALMIALFSAILYGGHLYAWILVVVLQTLIFKELVNVRYRAAAEKNIPWFRSIQWSWFLVALIYNYGDSFATFVETRKIRVVPPFVVRYLGYHTWVSFSLYAVLFVMSVLSLKKGYYKYQMGQYTWTIVTLGLIVFQMKYVLFNIFNGLFWFVFPVSLVICNDCCAFFCGKVFGRKFIRTPFLRLSPNKTWEGFVGAFLCTIVFGALTSAVFAKFQWMICPLETLQLIPADLSCHPNPVFIAADYHLPSHVAYYLGKKTIKLMPIQLHSMVFSIFTSLIAPFGGFYASAIKRTYKLKDFDSVIPGHGGVMDRMDCQFITALFTTVYYNTFIRSQEPSIALILNMISRLPLEKQQIVQQKLQEMF